MLPCGQHVQAFSRTLPGANSEESVAQFHMSVKPIGRSSGRSATGAAAYRAAERIVDHRTGEIHDYTHKGGVLATALVLPGGAQPNRAEFWNSVELHHKRKDATVAREFTLALPHELSPLGRVSVSIGVVAAVPSSECSAEMLVQQADAALYEAKKQGRNQVEG